MFVIVFLLVSSCLLITWIKCLKGPKSQGLLITPTLPLTALHTGRIHTVTAYFSTLCLHFTLLHPVPSQVPRPSFKTDYPMSPLPLVHSQVQSHKCLHLQESTFQDFTQLISFHHHLVRFPDPLGKSSQSGKLTNHHHIRIFCSIINAEVIIFPTQLKKRLVFKMKSPLPALLGTHPAPTRPTFYGARYPIHKQTVIRSKPITIIQ